MGALFSSASGEVAMLKRENKQLKEKVDDLTMQLKTAARFAGVAYESSANGQKSNPREFRMPLLAAAPK